MCSHVPNKGESFDLEALDRQMVRYYGYYSNVRRGKRKTQDRDEAIPSVMESEGPLASLYLFVFPFLPFVKPDIMRNMQ
jgi:hypothetical protein